MFTVFRDAEKDLRVQPSPHAWRKLENRLDKGQRQRGRLVSMRWPLAVAALFALVFTVWMWNENKRPAAMALQDDATPVHLEDLENTNGCNPFCLILEGRKQLPDFYQVPFRQEATDFDAPQG